MKTITKTGAAALLALIPLAATAMAAEPASVRCARLKDGGRISLTVNDGSSVELARALACLGGMETQRRRDFVDVPVSVHTKGPVDFHGALQAIRSSMSSACLRIRTAGPRLILAGVGQRCKPRKGSMKTVVTRAKSDGNVVVATTAAGKVTPKPKKKAPDPSILSDPASVTRVAADHYVLSPGIRDLAAKKPVAFTSEGLALPPGFNGDVRGFTMVTVRTGGLFDRMGLKRGDVLFAVNGMPLRDFADSRNAYRKLKNEARISLSVLRDGRALTLVYEFREITGGRRLALSSDQGP